MAGTEKRNAGACRMRLVAGLLLWIAAAVCAGVSVPAIAQVQVSPISDTVYYASGAAATGTGAGKLAGLYNRKRAECPEGQHRDSVGCRQAECLTGA